MEPQTGREKAQASVCDDYTIRRHAITTESAADFAEPIDVVRAVPMVATTRVLINFKAPAIA
jgi:hypothetical protein